MVKPVQLLMTFDVDPAPRLEAGIDRSLALLHELKVPATFFFAAAHATPTMIQHVLRDGHEVGCHGLHHDLHEEFNRLEETQQREILTEATRRLEQFGARPTAFRGPRVKVSATTLKILEELHYSVDSSVCSQRLDFLSSNLVNLGWLRAPRLPYHPAPDSPYRRGTMQLLEVPVSALLLPFISTTLRIFGVSFMKSVFRLLHWEAQHTGKPIVYLLHPHEFLYDAPVPFHWRMVIPNRQWRIDGSPLRRWLSRRHLGGRVYTMHQQFLTWVARQPGVEWLTMATYHDRFQHQKMSMVS